MESITSNRFVLNMLKGNYLQLRCCPLLFHKYKQVTINVSVTHHLVIQKEAHELLCKGANETSVVMEVTLMSLGCLSTQVAYVPFLILSRLITICIKVIHTGAAS